MTEQLSLFDAVVEIPLTQGYIALVDLCDEDLATMKWYADKIGRSVYVSRNPSKTDDKYTKPRLHRVVLMRMLGRPLQPNEQVDHIDGNGLNNRRANLRLASKNENNRNQRKRARNTSSCFKGVWWHKQRQKWQASIQNNGKRKSLGLYTDPREAARAYNAAARELHGPFARLNEGID